MQLHTTSTWVNPHESDFELRLRHAREEARAKQRSYWLLGYDGAAALRLIDDLKHVLRTMNLVAIETDAWYVARHYPNIRMEDAQEHKWHYKLQSKFKMHRAVLAAVEQYRPRSVHSLVFEWPHVSETDPNRLAYTRDNRSGHEDRQVITTVGKYLARHFPDMPDHAVRDLAARYAGYRFEMWDTTERIIRSVQEGPASCMQWGEETDYNDHPYRAYDPNLGWRAAVRLDGHGHIVGRCLVNVETKTFVRSYAHKDGGYSHSDEGLETWLREQGFSKDSDWIGCKLAMIDNGWGKFMAPYLDGDCKRVKQTGNYLFVCEEGPYVFECTNGSYEEDYGRECDDCGDSHDEDSTTWVGRHEDHGVCPSCSRDYTYVYGRRGNQYYIHNDNAVSDACGDEWYDPEFLGDNNMVVLHDGDIVSMDDAVYLEGRGEYWHVNDDDIVFCDHDDRYEHIEDVTELEDGTYADPDNIWTCHVSGDIYHEVAHKRERVLLSLLTVDFEHDYVSVHEDNIHEFHVDFEAILNVLETL